MASLNPVSTKKVDNLKKMNLIELREVLNREESLLHNKSLMAKLPDKGESIRKFQERVKSEINYREGLVDIESCISSLKISETDKHVQKLCELEKIPAKERYKPFSTLIRTQELHTDRKVFKTMEDWSKCNKPTKLIPLKESIDILKQQDEKVKEEQIKVKHRFLISQIKNEDSSDEGSGNSDNDAADSSVEESN